jgi:hypothetical protein
METKTLVETWKIKGRTYEGGDSKFPEDIPIKESEVLKGNKFGEAIDAMLAVSYIRDLWKAVAGDKFLAFWDKNENSESYIDQLTSGKVDKNNIEMDKLVSELKELKLMSAISAGWAQDLLHNSFALTVKKSLILKALSQPTCEGLRFYLCMKNYMPRMPEELTNPDKIILPSGDLALVTVGIDILEKDLHYDYSQTTHEEAGPMKIPIIENTSLCEEYPKRSGRGLFEKDLHSVELRPYALFKYSRHPFTKEW